MCFEDYLVPGEVLYYGHGWHHETQNLETPTMTLTDTVTGKGRAGCRATPAPGGTCAWGRTRSPLRAPLPSCAPSDARGCRARIVVLAAQVAHEHNFAAIADQLHATCVWNKLRFEFSASLCDALDRCYDTLHQV